MSNPYQPPASNLRRPGEGGLYSVHGVVIATVLGSLAAGVVLIYLNYRMLGNRALAKKLALWGAALFLIVAYGGSFVPGSAITNFGAIVLQGVIAYFFADRLQGSAIRYHQQHNGLIYSSWLAAGVGLLTGLVLVVLLGLAALVIMMISGATPTAPA